MKHDDHPEHGRLIDFVEGDLAREEARRIEAHLAVCEACRDFVRSVESTFSALEMDRVPELPESFFEYLPVRARARAGRSRKALLLKLIPGVASAALVFVLMWWLAGSRVTPVDGVGIIMAKMTTGEIVEAVSSEPAAGSMLMGDSAADLEEIEAYLLETESIYDLLDSMSEAERARFAAYLERSMSGDLETSGPIDGYMRKEC